MADYVFDLGFDWNVTLNDQHNLPLSIGLAAFESTGQPFSEGTGDITYSVFKVGDKVSFNGFNLTVGSGLSGYEITGGNVAFTNASPFSWTSIQIQPVGQTHQILQSAIFAGGNQYPDYPFWCGVIPPYPLLTKGTFKFTVQLQVKGPDRSKTFIVDPEMIVQATG